MRFFWGWPSRALLDFESSDLAEEDFSETERPTGEDHELHAAGKICAYCGQLIAASEPARRTGENDWVHGGCHKPRDRASRW
jgi:hypothetical protein